jgi:hypothetical protein
MRLLGIGFGRTGTLSLKTALEYLGASPCFHMLELLGGENKDRDLPYWVRIANGEPVDWREVFKGWKATVDWPGCTRWEELIDAFPDVPVLLNKRDFDPWYASCENTLLAVRNAALAGELADDANRTPPPPELWDAIDSLIWDGDFQGRFEDKDWMRRMYDERNRAIRERVPADRLIVWELGVDGWGPLADALGVPVPTIPFPHLHDTDAFRAEFGLPPLA